MMNELERNALARMIEAAFDEVGLPTVDEPPSVENQDLAEVRWECDYVPKILGQAVGTALAVLRGYGEFCGWPVEEDSQRHMSILIGAMQEAVAHPINSQAWAAPSKVIEGLRKAHVQARCLMTTLLILCEEPVQ
jgi:hypothetical protein